MVINKEVLFWLLASLFVIGFVALLHEVMLPFVLGLAIAYFLDPVADRLQRLGLGRMAATSIISLLLGLIILIGLFTLMPVLFEQAVNLVQNTPRYLDTIYAMINSYGKQYMGDDFNLPHMGYRDAIKKLTAQYSGNSGDILKSIWSGSKAFISFMSLILITPVVAFYMLHDWDRMMKYINSITPREHDTTIASLAREVDSVISGFMRGQVTVCLILGLYYAISLSLIGLNSGFLIGVGIGLISFIPFIGAIVGVLVGGGVAIAQFAPDWFPIGLVVLVFAIGQILEGNFLTPRIIGGHVRLHPVWLIFALFVSGYLFGFVGMLLAVPVAASIGVITRFAMDKYKASEIYQGDETPCQDNVSSPATETEISSPPQILAENISAEERLQETILPVIPQANTDPKEN